nr:MAG TPA: hypothetical protein [Caudoviricetes sp.]
MIKRCAVYINRANGETPIKQNWTIPCRAIGLSKPIEDLTTMADECKSVE